MSAKKKKGDNKIGGDQNRYQPFITSVEVLQYILHLFRKEYDISHIVNNSNLPSTTVNYNPPTEPASDKKTSHQYVTGSDVPVILQSNVGKKRRR